MEFDCLFVAGRFQPFHLGHKHVVDDALARAGRVVVLAGSANRSRSLRDPFTFAERRETISAVYREAIDAGRLAVEPLADELYDEDGWIATLQRAVVRTANDGLSGTGFVAASPASARYWRAAFPGSPVVQCDPGTTADSAQIRRDYFCDTPALPEGTCPPETIAMLDRFRTGDAFRAVLAEADYVRSYRESWSAAPFPPIFVTVDALVVQSGHVLLVTRGHHPGKGLLALPGGFLDPGETLRAAAIRELLEETGMADSHGAMSAGRLDGLVDAARTRVFDAPDRSSRGRTITHCFLVRLPETGALSAVAGSDDAAHAAWYPIGRLQPERFLEDHFFIIRRMLGAAP